ncbi:MAG: mercury resistance system transport protein MerF [Gammaproteobacteria bacterium]
MQQRTLLHLGIVGTVILALCCFTPVLVILFAVAGLSALTGYLDYVLFPALGLLLCLTIYAAWKSKRTGCDTSTGDQDL